MRQISTAPMNATIWFWQVNDEQSSSPPPYTSRRRETGQVAGKRRAFVQGPIIATEAAKTNMPPMAKANSPTAARYFPSTTASR